MNLALMIIVGAVVAAVVLLPFRSASEQTLKRLFAVGLSIAAMIYVGFSAVGLVTSSAAPEWAGIELAGLVVFSIIAYWGFSRPWFLAVGWFAHIFWDTGLHMGGHTEFVPVFYPPVCIGFDLAFAVIIAYYFYWRQRD